MRIKHTAVLTTLLLVSFPAMAQIAAYFFDQISGRRFSEEAAIQMTTGVIPGITPESCPGCGGVQAPTPTAGEIAAEIRRQDQSESYKRAYNRVERSVAESYAREFGK
ncbi:hypothetical protein SAMN04488595_11860 [Ralstonia sp. 25mfcol4.1]|uniref:hypothetical protein n=1 Tax=Ralstonia sp. 25mfcol4.1 TaxID=1761899 RepID=UPI000416FFD5|nr:hypothetical protein [Ralstonia sp. 25mfcol4.1]SDP72519.1 hypothetical protein SAMN04488595_11860 [Ralstonia sp. 25mfcol4.1]